MLKQPNEIDLCKPSLNKTPYYKAILYYEHKQNIYKYSIHVRHFEKLYETPLIR